VERSIRDLGGPRSSWAGTWIASPTGDGEADRNNKEESQIPLGTPKADQSIVLGERESRSHGWKRPRGRDWREYVAIHRKHWPDGRIGETVQTLLEGIAKKAKEQPKYRFRNLYTMLNEAFLKECWRDIRKDKTPPMA
jgi:hypothetical protein